MCRCYDKRICITFSTCCCYTRGFCISCLAGCFCLCVSLLPPANPSSSTYLYIVLNLIVSSHISIIRSIIFLSFYFSRCLKMTAKFAGGSSICMELGTCSGLPFPSYNKWKNIFRSGIEHKHRTMVQQQPQQRIGTNKLFAAAAGASNVRARMVSNGYAGRNNTTKHRNNTTKRIYKRLDSCLVIPPPYGKKPLAIVKFLGGAFIGAIPEVTYSYLLELLANEGYLIISVPYNVTFDHAQATREIYDNFHACFEGLSTSGIPSMNLTAAELVRLPLYCVGHSNGALLQVLAGSYFSEKIPKANVIISYNNRPATEAVPYFEQVGPLASQLMPVLQASPIYSLATNASGDAWKVLLDMAAMVEDFDQEAAISLNKFVDQLPSVLNQVTQGISEFKPTPRENRDCCKKSYNVKHTLLVKFNFDAIDETDLLEETLKPRVDSIGGTLEKVLLQGNHVTPCVQVILISIIILMP
ncbi:hypothetical protein NMG60_11025728 [Bertholletia excelsa]